MKKFNWLWGINASAMGIAFGLYNSGLLTNTYDLIYDFSWFVYLSTIPFLTLLCIGGAIGMVSEHRTWGQKSTIWWVCSTSGAVLLSYLYGQ